VAGAIARFSWPLDFRLCAAWRSCYAGRHEDRDLEHQRRARPHRQPLHWLTESAPDIVCLQEIKTVDDQFPRAEIEALGYNVETNGQKGFNGVALLSKLPFDEVNRGLPGDDTDEQARFHRRRVLDRHAARSGSSRFTCQTAIRSPTISSFRTSCPGWRVWSAGRPNAWRSKNHWCWRATTMSSLSRIDARHPENWLDDALFQPETRQAFRRLCKRLV
jgi:exodeoxyribonuclease-3